MISTPVLAGGAVVEAPSVGLAVLEESLDGSVLGASVGVTGVCMGVSEGDPGGDSVGVVGGGFIVKVEGPPVVLCAGGGDVSPGGVSQKSNIDLKLGAFSRRASLGLPILAWIAMHRWHSFKKVMNAELPTQSSAVSP